ncbi:MAG: DUF4443 domain-containing protein [Thermoproteota archaeon]
MKHSASIFKKIEKEFNKHPKDFSLGHVLLIIFYTGMGRISRSKVKGLLGLGEGSVKSLFKFMRSQGLLATSRGGSGLTPRGARLLDLLRKHIPDFRKADLGYLSVGKFNYAIVLRRLNIPAVLKIRDEAVKLGGTGAVVMFFKEGVIKIPYGSDDLKTLSPEDYRELSQMSLVDNDCILVVGGETEAYAISALGSILFELISQA